MSAEGIAQISLVLGSCTAGGAYVPAMSDESIIVKGQGTIFLGGPPLVKAATGVDLTAEELGGADLHCKHSGVCDHMVLSDDEAILKARSIISNFGVKKSINASPTNFKEPLFKIEDLAYLTPHNTKKFLSLIHI